MRDFACCGVTWPDFHKLLEHWEQSHNSPKAVNAPTFSDYAQLTSLPATSIMANPRTTQSSGLGQLGGRVAGSMGQQNRQPANFSGGAMSPSVNPLISGSRQTLSASSAIGHSHSLNEDLESVADMEMDDAVGPMEMDDGQRTMLQTRQLFGQASRPQLQINASNISQALRTSQPPTPAAASFGLQHNPTVSSVNTPTLTTQHFQRSQPSYLQTTAASAVADDDDEMDEDLPGLPMATDLTGLGFGRPADETSTTIANPGANLSTPTGGMTQRQQLLAQMAIEQNPALLHQLSIMQHQEEHKPYKCPVIGCEKAYKNQNGLK
jgi:transcription factor SFP1